MGSYKAVTGHKSVIFSKAKAINYKNQKQLQVSFIIRGTKIGLHCFLDCEPDNNLLTQFLRKPLPHHLDKNEHELLADFINREYVEVPFSVAAIYNPKTKYNDVVSIKPRIDLPCFATFLKEHQNV